jgi:molybdopterin converting factor small subunit
MVDLLVGQYGLGFRHSVLRDDGHVWPEVAILINGTNITLGQGLTTQLEEGDTVAIIPVITGGSSGLPLSQNG